MIKDSENELLRIQDALSRCGLNPTMFDLDRVSDFIDISLQHHGKPFDEGSHCKFVAFDDTGSSSENVAIAQLESKMYDKAIQIYCNLKSQKAFDERYKWPDMPRDSDKMY